MASSSTQRNEDRNEDRAASGWGEAVAAGYPHLLLFGSAPSGLQWRAGVRHASYYPSYFARDQVTTACHHSSPVPPGMADRSQEARPLPVTQCFLSAHTSPSTLGCTLLGLGDCKHIFAGSLPAGFLLPMEDSEEQKVGGRKRFLTSGSDGGMVVGNWDNGSGIRECSPGEEQQRLVHSH